MSLFQVQEWFGAVFPNAHALCVAGLVPGSGRDQLIVGCLDGTLSVLDPGREPDRRQEFAGLAELRLGGPVLQLCAGPFLPSAGEGPVLAVLLPSSLLFLRLSQTNDSFMLEQVFQHRIPGPPAFNMCQGNFGASPGPQLCVQSLQGHLALFEAENRILQRQIPDTLHPGPIGYSPLSESILLSSGGLLRSIRFASVIATGAKQVNVDWQLPLGDWAIQMEVPGRGALSAAAPGTGAEDRDRPGSVSAGGPQPCVLVLCKRALHCVSLGGCPQFSIRLQTVALCFTVLERAARIALTIATGTGTLLFHSDAKLIWSSRLPFSAQAVVTGTFSDSLRSLLVLLSDEGRVLAGYLGTEPSLFRMPLTQSRFIDFDERRRELRDFEETIWRCGRTNSAESTEGEGQFGLSASVAMDERSVAFLSADGVPSATVAVSLQQNPLVQAQGANLLLRSELHAEGTAQFPLGTAQCHFSLFCHGSPVLDPRCDILLISECSEVSLARFSVPLALICRETTAQRQAAFKISLDSSQPSLDLSALFPEFGSSGNEERGPKASLGLQPYFADQNVAVSIFTATKTNRYRIQSDSSDFVFPVFSELVQRIRLAQPEVRLSCSLPMHHFLASIAAHIEAENESNKLEKEASRVSNQMRHVETVFLSKLKSNDGGDRDRESSLHALVNHAYRELTDVLDRLNQLQSAQLGQHGRRSLRSALNLMNAMLRLNDIVLPFDGQILDETDQRLSQRIAQLLVPADENVDWERVNAVEVGKLLASVCERNDGKLGGILEEEEEEEEDEAEADKKLQSALENSEAFMEFSALESGSLSVKQLNDYR